MIAALVLLLATLSTPTDDGVALPAEVESRLLAQFNELPGEVRYFAAWVDLDGDGEPEMIVHVVGPSVCGSGGCTTMIFTGKGRDVRLVTQIYVTRPPIIVAATSTHGWRDLGVSSGNVSGHDAILRFDGKTYPDNPTVAPARKTAQPSKGRVVIGNYGSFKEGRLLKAL